MGGIQKFRADNMTNQKEDVEIEKYFERDIIEFLDRKKVIMKTGNTEGAENVEEDMAIALSKNDVELAAKILEVTVNNFNKITEGDVYKEIYFSKIQELARQAEEFLRINPEQNILYEDITLLQESEQLEKGIISKIDVFEKRQIEHEEKELENQEKEADKVARLNKKIKEVNQRIFINLRKKDLKEAINDYKKLKELFEKFPASFEEEKQEFYNDLLAFFMQIQKLKKDLVKIKRKSAEEKALFSIAKQEEGRKYIKIQDIKDIVNNIKQDVRNSDFDSARQKIIELKHISSKIPEEYKHLRTLLESKINTINQRVEMIKKMASHRREAVA